MFSRVRNIMLSKCKFAFSQPYSLHHLSLHGSTSPSPLVTHICYLCKYLRNLPQSHPKDRILLNKYFYFRSCVQPEKPETISTFERGFSLKTWWSVVEAVYRWSSSLLFCVRHGLLLYFWIIIQGTANRLGNTEILIQLHFRATRWIIFSGSFR